MFRVIGQPQLPTAAGNRCGGARPSRGDCEDAVVVAGAEVISPLIALQFGVVIGSGAITQTADAAVIC